MLTQRADGLWYPWVNHDTLELLLTGRQVVAGDAALYRDAWDPNFPATHALTMLANRLGGREAVGWFHAGLLLLAWFGGLCLLAGLRTARPGVLLAVLGTYLLVVVCPTIPVTQDFGQREHLFALVLVPWLAWRLGVVDRPPAWLRLPLAFWTGWLGTIKPTFLLIPIAVELVHGRRAGGLGRAEQGAVVAGIVAPWIPFAILDPGALRAFVLEVLPVQFTPWYRLGFGIPWHEVWRRPQPIVTIAAGIGFAFLLARGVRRRIVTPAEARGWIAGLAAAALGPAVQGTGFAYHFIPLQAVLWTGLAATGMRVIGARWMAAASLVALSLGWMSFSTYVRWGRRPPSGITRLVPPRSTVMIVALDVGYAYDAWYQDWTFRRGWGARVLFEGQRRDPDRARGAAGLARDRARILDGLRTEPEFLLVRFSPVRDRTSLEDALIHDLRVLPPPGYRRLSDAEITRRAGPDAGWHVYERQRVR